MELGNFIQRVIAEDMGDGDHTSLACIPEGTQKEAQLLIKESGVMAGIEVARQLFTAIDPSLNIHVDIEDGQRVYPHDIAFTISGEARSILGGERLVLNCMQRMSGIATLTASLAGMLEGTKAKILDTRKTTPGFRALEKWAVRIGGGQNHRMGLYDMIMIKDNHIDYAGGIEAAITSSNRYLQAKNKNLLIEIEARNLEEVREIIRVGRIHRIMLDNFSIEETRAAVELIAGSYETESSGNITNLNIRSYAECGVDYISVGALTHSARSMDMSLKAV